MVKQFVYLNFHTEYSSEGTLNKEMEREYCFGDVFYNDAEQDNYYEIRIYKNLSGVEDGAKNNACFMSKDELFNYISIAKRIHDFSLEIDDDEEHEMFTVKLSLDAPRVVHRYILTWLRYSYEFPFNMYLMDAMRLKNTTGFRRDDLFNLYNLVSASSGYEFHGDNIHCIGNAGWVRKFYPVKEQIQIVEKAENTQEVNDLYPAIAVKIDHLDSIFNDYFEDLKSLEFWQDNKLFKKRVSLYKKNKELIKEFQNKQKNHKKKQIKQ